jgi:glycosyltransferase involved in cell wall biosynthesis
VRRLVAALDARFFARSAAALLSASGDVTRQVDGLTGGRHAPVFEFLPTYLPGSFEAGPPPAGRPFRVFFAGRVERDKGVFDLLAVTRRFADAGRTDIEFDVCGSGSALDELRRAAEEAGLAERFRCHGYCSRESMRQMYARAHAVIVPTTSDFIEGFNQVVAEGVLSGRPVITSRVCPALDYVRDAVVEVGVDDIQGYGDAILRLCDDEAFYREKCRGCAGAQAQFYDPERGWAAALKKALARLGLTPAAEAATVGAPGGGSAG